MSMYVAATGLVTAVGMTAPAACAAIRAGIRRFEPTRFRFDGDWIAAAQVPFAAGFRGPRRLVEMVVPSIGECLRSAPDASEPLLLLCGPFAADDVGTVLARAGAGRRLHAGSRWVDGERLGCLRAMALAAEWLREDAKRCCIVAAADSLLSSATLQSLHAQMRLRTAKNSDGIIPGEAGAAILLSSRPRDERDLECAGIGEGPPAARRGEALAGAILAALGTRGGAMAAMDYVIADVGGEQAGFSDLSIALTRVTTERRPSLPVWTPRSCVGDVGAAYLPLAVAVATQAARRSYAPGAEALVVQGEASGERGALRLRRGGGMR